MYLVKITLVRDNNQWVNTHTNAHRLPHWGRVLGFDQETVLSVLDRGVEHGKVVATNKQVCGRSELETFVTKTLFVQMRFNVREPQQKWTP